MEWIDIVSIVFVAVTVNHLGLVSAIEEVTGRELPVINCPKCLTFWLTMVYWMSCYDIAADKTITMLAVSFLASYAAIWLELIEGYIDTIYIKLYEKITTTDSDNTVAADANNGHPESTVS